VVAGERPERGLETRYSVVVEVPAHAADEHPGQAHSPVASLEQVDGQRGIPLVGEPSADVTDVVVQPERLVDDDHARVGPGTVRQRPVGVVR
jgi:hypothetical protein